ncbi:MAG: hypothetical protein U0401_31750 [Anaerolineae bacterium]
MLKNFWQNKLIVSLTLIVALLLVLISACNLIDLSGGQTPTSQTPAFLTPLESKVLVHAPVQIQSLQPGANISRVELLVQGPNSTAETLVRADKPTDGVVLQQWIPQQTGQYTIIVQTYSITNALISPPLTRTIDVTDTAIALVNSHPDTFTQPLHTVFTTPALKSVGQLLLISIESSGCNSSGGYLTANTNSSPTPFYLPPPPAPGVPLGPARLQLNVHPPVCDAPEYMAYKWVIPPPGFSFLPRI